MTLILNQPHFTKTGFKRAYCKVRNDFRTQIIKGYNWKINSKLIVLFTSQSKNFEGGPGGGGHNGLFYSKQFLIILMPKGALTIKISKKVFFCSSMFFHSIKFNSKLTCLALKCSYLLYLTFNHQVFYIYIFFFRKFISL